MASFYKRIAMKAMISLIAFLFVAGIPLSQANAAVRLDGLWRNNKENISVRIQSTAQGIRAMRLDQSVWYFYTKQHEGLYSDGKGRFYEVRSEDEIMWREASTGKRILFNRVTNDQSDSRESEPDWQSDDDRGTNDRRDDGDWDNDRRRGDDDWDNDRDNDRHDDGRYDDYGNRSRFASLNGEWFSQNGRRTIDIRTERNGLRVYREDGRSILFAPTRDSKVFRNRHGDSIAWLNTNTIQMKTYDKHNFIFHRGGEIDSRGKHGHGYGHAKKPK